MTKTHVLSVLVENEPGVLSRVAGLFSGRGFNIHSLNVAPALEEGVSHMTITTEGDSLILEQIMKQLHKIVSVIKVVILNNRHLGMVRQWQELFYNQNYSSTNMEAQPDFVKLAEAYGAEGYRIEKGEDLRATLEKALASPNPAFIDVMVEREENVYPIVPAGAALDEMLLV